MNKIFKVVWNRTIQSFVVTSELAKGRVKSSAEQNSTDVSAESGKNGIATVFRLTVISAALLGAGNSYAATAGRGLIAVDPPTSATAVSGATATGIGALSVGASANATANGAVAVGTSANATHNNSLAVGTNAKATQTHAVAMGADTSASSSYATAIGKSANAVSADSTALGADSKANGTQATAVGKNALANNVSTTALGNEAQAYGIGSMALGKSSTSRGQDGIAIGSGSQAAANAQNAIAIGTNAVGYQSESIAIGNSTQAQTGNTIAIGKSAVANSPSSGSALSSAIALGADANATGLGTIAIGRASGVLSQNIMHPGLTHNNIAIGNTARVGDSSSPKITQAIAIGSGNRVDAQGRPEGAWAKGDQSIAVGGNVVAEGNSSISVGGDDLDSVGGTQYSGSATDKFIKYNAQGAKVGEYALRGKNLRDIYKEMTGDTMNSGVYGNTIAGQGSVALGVQSNSSADLSLAIGTKSQATAFGGVALGTGAKATLLNSVALGTASKTDKEGRAYVQREIMGVTYTWAGGQTTDAGDVVSVGSQGYERQIINVSPGDISATSTDAINGSQLYGVLNALERVRYFSVKSEEGKTDGTKNWNNDGAKATNSIAIGPNAATSTGATGSVSLGHNANVLGSSSVAVGPNATVTSGTVGAVALGSNANSRGTGSIAIGLNTENDRNYSIVVGAHSRANYENATVVGARAAAQNNGTAMGYLSNAVGDDSVAIGHQAQTAQSYSIAIGKQANSSGLYSTAIGSSAQAAGQNSFAGGNNAKATGSDSVALGNGATTTVGSSVALGNGAVGTANNFDATAKNATFKNDSGAATNVSYAASSSSKTGAVSVGSAGNERQIQNVAAGRISATSTDAVNGSQLYTVMNNVGHNIQQNGTDKSRINNNGTVNYANGNLTTVAVTDGENASKVQINVTQGTLSVNNNGTVSAPTAGVATAGDVANAINNAKTTTNVAAGSNTHVNKTTSGKETTYTVSADKATVQVSNALNLTSNTTTASDGAVTTNYSIDLAQSTKDNIQKGVDAKTAVDSKGLTFSGDNGSTNIEKLGSTVTVAGDDNITTEARDDKVTVKLKKDLVVNSVEAGDTTVNNDGVKVGDDVALTQDGVKAGDVKLTKDGLNNAGKKVTNVADGDLNANSKDAVNGSQLFATNQNVANNAANIAKGINFGGTAGSNNYALGDTINVKGDSNIISETVAGGAQLKLAKDITVDSVTAGDSKLNTDGLTITGGPSVTKSGINAAGNKITNVAAGTDDNDAVNYSQLKQQSAAARTEVRAGTNIKDVVKTVDTNGQDVYTVNAKGTTASAGSSKVTVTAAEKADNVTDYSIDLADGTKAEIQKGVDAKTAVDNKGLTFNGDSGSTNVEKLGSTVTVAGDDNITTEARDDKVTVKLKKDLVVNSVEAGDTTVNNDGVKVGDDVALTQDGVKAGDVKLTKDGLNNAGKKVTNVADGDLNANSKDAVNGSQLFATNQNVANNAANIAKGINFGGTAGSNNYALGDTINVKGDSNIISETVAGGAQLKLADVLNVGQAAPVKIDGEKGEVSGLSNTTLGGSDFAQGKRAATEEQLNAAQDQLVNVLGGNAANNGGNISMTDIGGTGENNIHDAIKAVNATANLPLTFGGDSGKDVERKPGTKLNIVGGQTDAAKLSDGNIGVVANGSDKLEVKLAKDLAVDSVKAGDTTVNTDGVKVGDVNLTKAGLDNGGNKITNVAAGTDDTDAVNVAQLNKAAAAAKTEVVQGDNIVVTQDVGANGQTIYKVATDKNLKVDSVTAGDTVMNNDGVKVGDDVALNKDGLKVGDVNLTKAGLNNGGNKITNVAAGTDDTDAVNVSQLKQAAAASKTEVVQGKNIVVTEKTGDKGQTVYEVATNKDLDVDSVKAGDTAVNTDGVKVGDDVALNKDGLKAGKVNLTKDGLDNAGNKVTNVADGDINANSKDAVNGSQLYATNQNVANNAATIAKGINFGGTTGSNNYALGDTINVKGDSNIISETVAGGAQLKLADEISVKTVNADTFKAGDTVMNNDGVKVGDKVALNKDGLTAGNTVVNNDGVTIAAPTENNPNNQVKLSPVGLNNGGQRITNVAPGKDGTDAANVNQLIGLGTELQNNINQVGKKAYAGVAGAIAQGSIPQVTRPGATGIGVGSGYYGGQSAMAIGVSAMSDGGNWIVKGNFSANTDGHVGVGAGALYQW